MISFNKLYTYLPSLYTARMILEGLLSYIPGLNNVGLKGKVITDYTLPARYYYSVWLRHLVMAHKNGLSIIPDSVAELGPGQSLGIGIAALLSGASSYSALDVVEFASVSSNVDIFHDLVKLFKDRANIPDSNEFSSVEPHLESYKFPHNILPAEHLDKMLNRNRLNAIKNSLQNQENNGVGSISIAYKTPWNDPQIMEKESVDFILSQAVLEHVDDLPGTYKTMHAWLKPGGYMSHAIDFRSHGVADDWNGQWIYSMLVWELIKGNRPYLLNREPYSAHIDFIKENGFKITCDIPTYRKSKIKRKNLASEFRGLSDQDLSTRTTFLQAEKPK